MVRAECYGSNGEGAIEAGCSRAASAANRDRDRDIQTAVRRRGVWGTGYVSQTHTHNHTLTHTMSHTKGNTPWHHQQHQHQLC